MEKESRYASSTEMVVENHFLLSAHFTDHDLTVAICAHRFSQIANQNRIFAKSARFQHSTPPKRCSDNGIGYAGIILSPTH